MASAPPFNDDLFGEDDADQVSTPIPSASPSNPGAESAPFHALDQDVFSWLLMNPGLGGSPGIHGTIRSPSLGSLDADDMGMDFRLPGVTSSAAAALSSAGADGFGASSHPTGASSSTWTNRATTPFSPLHQSLSGEMNAHGILSPGLAVPPSAGASMLHGGNAQINTGLLAGAIEWGFQKLAGAFRTQPTPTQPGPRASHMPDAVDSRHGGIVPPPAVDPFAMPPLGMFDYERHDDGRHSSAAAAPWGQPGLAPPSSRVSHSLKHASAAPDSHSQSRGGSRKRPAPAAAEAPTSGAAAMPAHSGAGGGKRARRNGDGSGSMDGASSAPSSAAIWEGGASSSSGGGDPSAGLVCSLRSQVEELRAENAALRAQVRALSLATSKDTNEREAERQAQLRRLQGMVASNAPEGAMRQGIVQYKDLHSDFGRDRWIALRHHLRCLKGLLLPNQVTKIAMWSVAQEGATTSGGAAAASGAAGGAGGAAAAAASAAASAATNPAASGSSAAAVGPAGIWAQLASHCEMTGEQQQRILGLRDSVRQRRRDFADLLSSLQRLEGKITGNFTGLELQMNMLMSHLSPRQIALFLDWMETNQGLFGRVATLSAWPAPPPDGAGGATSAASSGGKIKSSGGGKGGKIRGPPSLSLGAPAAAISSPALDALPLATAAGNPAGGSALAGSSAAAPVLGEVPAPSGASLPRNPGEGSEGPGASDDEPEGYPFVKGGDEFVKGILSMFGGGGGPEDAIRGQQAVRPAMSSNAHHR